MVLSLFGPALERVLAFPQLNEKYQAIQSLTQSGSFAEKALQILNISIQVRPEDLAKIPATGPLVIVANHPFGGLEWIILKTVVQAVRTDVKFLANYMLRIIPDLHESLLFVDPFEKNDSP